MKPRVLLCMPTYNEGNRSAQQLNQLFVHDDYDLELFVIDDGCTDDTIPLIEKEAAQAPCPVTIVHNPGNQGVGYSLKRGIQYARQNKFDIIMNTAGNGKDDWQQIPVLLQPLLKGTHDYVTGSRFLDGGSYKNLPFARKYMMKAYTFAWNVLTWNKITDITNGFRAYTTTFTQDPRIVIEQKWLDRYELEYYLYYKALTLPYRVCEVPVSKTYPQQSRQKKIRYTKIRPLIDWWKMIRPLVYLRLGIKK